MVWGPSWSQGAVDGFLNRELWRTQAVFQGHADATHLKFHLSLEKNWEPGVCTSTFAVSSVNSNRVLLCIRGCMEAALAAPV